MTLSELLQELEISEEELSDWIDELLIDYSPRNRVLIANYLKRHPRFLVLFLQGELSIEDVFRILLELCPGTEIEVEPPPALVNRWASEGCLAELVALADMSILVALALIERPAVEVRGEGSLGVHRKMRPKNI